MKKKYLYSSAAAILISFASYQLGRYQSTQPADHSVAYVNSKQDHSDAVKTEELTPDEISEKEGISAEQIVVKITDQGYVTSHGDHFHFYNGKVPFDAIISEELLLKDSSYVFKESDIVSEVKDGYIIKLNGHYYLYLKEGVKPTNLRTKEEIARQQKGEHGHEHGHTEKASKKVNSSSASSSVYRTDDGYVFKATDIIEDLGDGYLVPHGDHFHFIPKNELSPAELAAARSYLQGKTGTHHKEQSGHATHATNQNAASSTSNHHGSVSLASLLEQLYALPLSQRYKESDGLVFDPAQIVKRTATGVVVPHGDHFHFIPYNRLSSLERQLAESMALSDKSYASRPHISSPARADNATHASNATIKEDTSSMKPDQPSSVVAERPQNPVTLSYFNRTIVAYGKGLDGKAYDTSDGYVFSKTSIQSVDDNGLTARHGDHFHYIGFGELEAFELKQVEEWVKEKNQSTDNTALEQPQDNTIKRPRFDYKLVSAKVNRDGEVGYLMTVSGQSDHFFKRSELDLTQIAFAEQTLMMSSEHYILDIVSPKEGELEPKLYRNAKDIKAHAANATYDTGDSFIIPHIDHIHIVPYSWLTKEELASVKYIMQHPQFRPSVWTEEHEEDDEPSVSVTPISERAGLQNWQIVHSADEVRLAKQEGRYATEDGYIFLASDILAPKAMLRALTNQLVIPKASGNELRYISKQDLSEKEWSEAVSLYEKKQADSSTGTGTDEMTSEETSSSSETTKERAIEVYERAVPANIIPLEKIPYNLGYAVGFRNGRIIVPHHDHYHNIVVAWFDDVFEAPAGYTLEELFATVKYYIENPDERPTSDDGWGNSSSLMDNGVEKPSPQPNDDIDSDDEEEEEEEEDEFELSLKGYAADYGMPLETFRRALINIALKYKVSMEAFIYQPEAGTVSFVNADGETITVSVKE